MRLIEPLRGRGAAFELVTPIPYTALQHMLDETGPWGIRAYDKGINLDEPFSRCAPTPFA